MDGNTYIAKSMGRIFDDLRNRPSERQLGYISHFLQRNYMNELADYTHTGPTGKQCNAPLVGATNWIRGMVDKMTCSNVIALIQDEKGTEAWNQLVHLGLPTKPKDV